MLIREMTKEDNKKVKQIIQDSLESLDLAIPGTAYFDPQLGNLYEYYKSLPNAKYWVMEVDGEVVGGVGIAPFNESERICELQKLYLVPKVQGNGLSKKLMDVALHFAANHYDKCYLESHHKLVAAYKLYEKFGFTLLKEPLPGSEHSAMDMWYIKELNE